MYMWVVHEVYRSQVKLMQDVAFFAFLICLLLIIAQLISLIVNKSRLIGIKLLATIAGLVSIAFLGVLVSLIRNPVLQNVIPDFFQAVKSGDMALSLDSLKNIIARVLDAEGVDLALSFFLALLSGLIIYSPTARFDWKNFRNAFMAWLIIISINEIIQYCLPFREGDMRDIIYNMAGVTLGLLLSIRWLWRNGK